jgi:formate hydrogenlyase subunit 6/NADH:ubiquinone oxidoreductase subunit I
MDRTLIPQINRARCTLCGLCVTACPCRAIELRDQGVVFHCAGKCQSDVECPHGRDCFCICEEACPHDAIECPFEIVLQADQIEDLDVNHQDVL